MILNTQLPLVHRQEPLWGEEKRDGLGFAGRGFLSVHSLGRLC